MKTRQEKLIHLVAGLGSWTPNEGKVEHAVALLAEIEKVCLDTTLDEAVAAAGIEDAKDLVRWCTGMRHARGKLNEAMAQAAADERERCAKIAESLDLKDYEDNWIRSAIASNIRRGGA